MSTPSAPDDVRVYRLATGLVLRFVGSSLVALALLLFLATAVVALAGLPPDLLLVPVGLGVVGAVGLGWWLRRRAWVLRLDAEGYAVRMVRGARVREAAWREVREVQTTAPRGLPCLVLSLGEGRDTVVPVSAIEGDREELVREVRRRLRAARG